MIDGRFLYRAKLKLRFWHLFQNEHQSGSQLNTDVSHLSALEEDNTKLIRSAYAAFGMIVNVLAHLPSLFLNSITVYILEMPEMERRNFFPQS